MIELQKARTLLSAFASEWAEPEANRLDVRLPAEALVPAAQALLAADWGYLVTITGLDAGPEAGTMETLYHFASGAAVLTLRVAFDRNQARVPSICGAIPYASPFEREAGEMFGITFEGTPDTAPLFLPDDWPQGVYPLRKDGLQEETDT